MWLPKISSGKALRELIKDLAVSRSREPAPAEKWLILLQIRWMALNSLWRHSWSPGLLKSPNTSLLKQLLVTEIAVDNCNFSFSNGLTASTWGRLHLGVSGIALRKWWWLGREKQWVEQEEAVKHRQDFHVIVNRARNLWLGCNSKSSAHTQAHTHVHTDTTHSLHCSMKTKEPWVLPTGD